MGYLNKLHDSKVHAMCFKIKVGICAHDLKDLAKDNTITAVSLQLPPELRLCK